MATGKSPTQKIRKNETKRGGRMLSRGRRRTDGDEIENKVINQPGVREGFSVPRYAI